jgi:hypothetical protein
MGQYLLLKLEQAPVLNGGDAGRLCFALDKCGTLKALLSLGEEVR